MTPRGDDDENRNRRSQNINDEPEEVNRLDSLPVEIVEMILQNLNRYDLLSAAAATPRLGSIVQCRLLWRNRTVRICGEDISSQIRQLQLAPSLGELQVGLGTLDRTAAKEIRQFTGPLANVDVDSLRLRISVVGPELGTLIMERYGRSTRRLDLDLRHGWLEEGRSNKALIQCLTGMKNLKSLSIRIDNVGDIFMLNSITGIQIVELDIHRLQLETQPLGPNSAANAVRVLVAKNSKHIQTLRLPPKTEGSLSASVRCCEELRTLACNMWTLKYVAKHKHLQSLHLFPPEPWVAAQHIVNFITIANTLDNAAAEIKELHFLRSDKTSDLPTESPHGGTLINVMVTVLQLCRNIEVVVFDWGMPDCLDGFSRWTWIDSFMASNPLQHLRELRFCGNLVPTRQLLSLASYCPALETLDVRGASRVKPRRKQSKRVTTTYGCHGMRTALDLAQWVHPNITILFDDDAENNYDWSFYPGTRETAIPRWGYNAADRLFTFEDNDCPVPLRNLHPLFIHIMSAEQWVSAIGIETPSPHDVLLWRCATVDSFLWPIDTLCHILLRAPALGLVDLRNRETLRPGKRGLFWLKALSLGPTDVGAIRIYAPLVSHDTWILMPKILKRVGCSLERLELDFRGRVHRDWRHVLSALSETPNIREFVLRGKFDDEKPVFEWLHGRLPSVIRLDLRDCTITSREKMTAFLVSLRILLEEVGGNLSALVLPQIPRYGEPEVMNFVSTMTELSEIGLHVNQLLRLRWFRRLTTLRIYGDPKPDKTRPLKPSLSWTLRHLGEVLLNVQFFIINADLFESQEVRDTVYDLMPNLRKLHIIGPMKEIKVCVEGGGCRDRSLWEQLLPASD